MCAKQVNDEVFFMGFVGNRIQKRLLMFAHQQPYMKKLKLIDFLLFTLLRQPFLHFHLKIGSFCPSPSKQLGWQ